MLRTTSSILFVLICLGTAQGVRAQAFDPAAIRGAIEPAIATNQALAKEVTIGLTRLKRICDKTVAPANQPPDPTALSKMEAQLATFAKDSTQNYALANEAVGRALKQHNKTTESSGVCKKPTKDAPSNYSENDCNNAKIVSNNYKLLEIDIKILNELLGRQVKAIEGVVVLEAKRCLRQGFSQKLFEAIIREGQPNHKTVGSLLRSLTGATEPPQETPDR